MDHLTAIFNFYLCVSQDADALIDIKEVALGGAIGTIVGGLFQAAALAAAGPFVAMTNCSSSPAQQIAFQNFATLYQWHSIWAIAIGLSFTYYALHLARMEVSNTGGGVSSENL